MYFNPLKQNAYDYKSEIYISKRLGVTQDEYLNQITTYSTPKRYFVNVQPVNASSDTREFGQNINRMKVAVIPQSLYIDEFREFDLAYLDGANPKGENENGDNANYRVYAVRNQNMVIRVYFEKLVKDNQM